MSSSNFQHHLSTVGTYLYTTETQCEAACFSPAQLLTFLITAAKSFCECPSLLYIPESLKESVYEGWVTWGTV